MRGPGGVGELGTALSWEAAGAPVVEQEVIAEVRPEIAEQAPKEMRARHFHRSIDTRWRRTSYSGLVRSAQEAVGVSSEPEVIELDDEVADIPLLAASAGGEMDSPMAQLPSGATFGTLVHAVLETADPDAPNTLQQVMCTPPEWAAGLPLNAEVETMTRYGK